MLANIVSCLCVLLPLLPSHSQAWLLGAGAGSCAAPPYRARNVYWTDGCPASQECCTEYGFCKSSVSADLGMWTLSSEFFIFQDDWYRKTSFRDCNGESNGLPLPASVIQHEMKERLEERVSAADGLLGVSSSWFSSTVTTPDRVIYRGKI